MGWNRIDLKMVGKDNFRKNYGNCLLVSFVILILSGSKITSRLEDLQEMNIELPGSVVVSIGLVSLFLGIFVIEVLKVGACRFYVENRDYNAPASKLGFGFTGGHYVNVMGTMFLLNIKIFLWTLLLLIPGVVKSYEYRMVPYILAEQPDINQRDAFRISGEMMNGQKLDAFILDLSFIGWWILSAFTCGLLGIFWTAPYVDAVDAELYAVLRDNWMRDYGNPQPDMGGFDF